MIIECINGQFVELNILGYQFPEILNDQWDSNWLMVHINVKSTKKHWESVDPAITTFELKNLINWLKNISDNKIEKYTDMDFTEPNIAFELKNNFDSTTKEIKICFRLEFSPLKNGKKYSIQFKATNEQLKTYVKNLEYELNKFPER